MNLSGKFYIVREREISFKVNICTSLPIVWNRNGEFCVVPEAVLKNAVNIKKMYNKSDGKVTTPEVRIQWSQGIPISNLAGRALLGE